MNNLPEGPELLHVARDALLAELRPLVPEAARYTLAMIANAMAIAAREAQAGETAARAAHARLAALYEEPAGELSGAALQIAVERYERRLAADIRAGRFDAGDERRQRVLAHLRERVAARLRISNPKSIESQP